MINGIERYTFSTVINQLIEDTEPSLLPSTYELETGVKIKPENINYLYSEWIKYLIENDMWMPWMNNWTDGSIYLLYMGTTEI